MVTNATINHHSVPMSMETEEGYGALFVKWES